MPCRVIVELVTEYLEGTLALEERVRFEAHIGCCGDCDAYVEQMRMTLRVVGHLDPEELDPEVERAMLDAFRGWKGGGAG
jgi:predicted anti-sigma-YlaC factor YlaD